jgi:2-keto-4-pentenoate hydratase/2-oxohepta-3-ene-1,7-dioic acid hydratase in catechol pathway
MRIVNFEQHGEARLGLLAGETVIDPLAALVGKDAAVQRAFRDTVSFITAGPVVRRTAEQLIETAPAAARVALASVKLLAPMQPTTILCSGSNYHDHNAEKANTPISGKEPEFFIKTADCVVGPEAGIPINDQLSKKVDCETELAVIIGKPGRFIPLASALDHVFGYTIVNDVTARDRQVRTSPSGSVWYELGRGKCFDASAPMGPYIATADEIGDPQKLELKTRINGELRQHSNTSRMIWSCAELIHFFSTNFTLKPGMLLITGTPAGTSWSMDKDLGGSGKPPPGVVPAKGYCKPGDLYEGEIEKLGVLRNKVVQA